MQVSYTKRLLQAYPVPYLCAKQLRDTIQMNSINLKCIINVGVSKTNSDELNRKIRLNNIILIFLTTTFLIYLPVLFYFELHSLVIINLLMLATCGLSFFIQAKKKHLLGFTILALSMLILMSKITITFGLISNVHLFLMCSCMATMALFDTKKKLRITLLSLYLITFFGLLLFVPYKTELTLLSEQIGYLMKLYGYVNLLILFIFIIIFVSTFVKQSSNFRKKMLKQNAILEHKNLQITDSLKYAKHIQNAILPSLTSVKELLEESFILFQPKDIVAGDFYWMHKTQDDQILFAAADSTGHGVPGAMVSVVCTNALNQAVNEFGLTDPGKILDKVRELVISSFQQGDGGYVTDGMDISLCLINKNTRVIHWAGANNPLWIIREKSENLEIIKADKQSVSKTDDPKPFTTHKVELNPGDCFYFFTDGYADQFGGVAAKKYMQKRIKKLLLSIYKKSMDTQKRLISDNILHWMGNLEQVDDICFIGVKL